MATPVLSPAKVILLAVQASVRADIATLRTLIAAYPKILHHVILRILLTFLPESIDSSDYVPFLLDYDSGKISVKEDASIDTSELEGISNVEATKKVRRLHLLPLRMEHHHLDAPEDPMVLFVIHRAYRVDEETGLISQLPQLIVPFLERSEYLRDWMLGTILPLLRLNYEYHPHPTEENTQSIKWFEGLDAVDAAEYLLSRTIQPELGDEMNKLTIVRDLRGLAGPWLYGSNKRKCWKSSLDIMEGQTVEPLDETGAIKDSRYSDWDAVFAWIVRQTPASHTVVYEAIEQWYGAGDVDLGGYADPESQLPEEDRRQIDKHYGRCVLTAAFLNPAATLQALSDSHRILKIVIARLGFEAIPSLQAAAALLSPVTDFTEDGKSRGDSMLEVISFLKNEEYNFSGPTQASIDLLQAVLTSSYMFFRSGSPSTVENTANLVVAANSKVLEQITPVPYARWGGYQQEIVQTYLKHTASTARGDDKVWIQSRNELLWLHDWGLALSLEGAPAQKGRGVLGLLDRDFLQKTILTTLLSNKCYTLARQLYEIPADRPLEKKELSATVISAAMHAFNNAYNPDKRRGGVKKCLDILEAFPDTVKDSLPAERIEHLIQAAYHLSGYSMALNSGEPFKPSVIRTHGDPIALVETVLSQTTRLYSDIDNFLRYGEQVVLAGLTVRDLEGHSKMEPGQVVEQTRLARWRITSMCINAALVEDDFETAYSYVVNRLPGLAGDAYDEPLVQIEPRRPQPDLLNPPSFEDELPKPAPRGAVARLPPRPRDDYSWRAAFKTGKYRLNEHTVKPSHVGNSSANPEIRHLEQRMECLGQALRIAPVATLQEILNVFRRCEEELDAKIREEAEQEAKWDETADERVMPGKFGVEAPATMAREGANTSTARSRMGTEAPMSLFDLTRASAAQAQRSLAALTAGSGGVSAGGTGVVKSAAPEGEHEGVKRSTVRKRDQLRSAAVGTLAGGIGWLIGAPAPTARGRNEQHER